MAKKHTTGSTAGTFEERLVRAMQQATDIAEGKLEPARVMTVPRTVREGSVPQAPAYSATDVANIRHKMGMSQALFAQALNVSAGTVRSWEQGTKPPQGPSRRLLEIAQNAPDVLLSSVRSTSSGTTPTTATTTSAKRRSSKR